MADRVSAEGARLGLRPAAWTSVGLRSKGVAVGDAAKAAARSLIASSHIWQENADRDYSIALGNAIARDSPRIRRCSSSSSSVMETVLMRMTLFSLSGLVALSAVGGCANWIPSEARVRMNTQKSTYELCNALATASMAPKDVRSEWEMELRRRGESCGSYASDRKAKDAEDRAAITSTINSLLKAPSGGGSSVSSTSSGGSVRVTCLKQGESVSGFSRHCVYNCVGNEVIQTVSSIDLCPPSISR